jgi:hypothetical protein
MATHPPKLQTLLQPLPIKYENKTPSAGTILAVHKNTYTNIEPIHIPTNLQPYLDVALLQPKPKSKILAASIYMPHLHTP